MAGFADTCLVVCDTDDLPTDANPVLTTKTVANWQQVVTRLMASREEPTRIIRIAPKAGEVLADFSNRVAEESRKAPAEESRFLHHSTRLATKLALLRHLTQGDLSCPVPGDIVAAAVAMAELSTEHRLAVLEAVCTEPAAKVLRTVVLKKIVDFGPLSPRDICRHSHSLRLESLMPILHELVQAGEAVEQPDGRYLGVRQTELRLVTA